jgi:hypothetical protein
LDVTKWAEAWFICAGLLSRKKVVGHLLLKHRGMPAIGITIHTRFSSIHAQAGTIQEGLQIIEVPEEYF